LPWFAFEVLVLLLLFVLCMLLEELCLECIPKMHNIP
jgi:hypothetical protein